MVARRFGPQFTPIRVDYAGVLEIDVATAYLDAVATMRTHMANPVQFLQQVRSEVGKITWPTRREVFLTTIMVLALAALAAVFFSLVDWGIRLGVQAVVGS